MKHTLDWFLSNTNEVDGCLEWTKCFNTGGYPRVAYKGNSNGKAHRIVFQLATGIDPTGLVVMHTCDNTKCINPDHLRLGTATMNIQDRDRKERHGAAKLTHMQVRAIRSLLPAYRNIDIASMFGVDARTISSIRRNKHWKSVI